MLKDKFKLYKLVIFNGFICLILSAINYLTTNNLVVGIGSLINIIALCAIILCYFIEKKSK